MEFPCLCLGEYLKNMKIQSYFIIALSLLTLSVAASPSYADKGSQKIKNTNLSKEEQEIVKMARQHYEKAKKSRHISRRLAEKMQDQLGKPIQKTQLHKPRPRK